jgi:uncharacterized protein involved in exopolysaccharide biosynthesis
MSTLTSDFEPDLDDRPPRREIELERVTTFAAMRRYWPLVLLPVLVLAAAAAVVGLQRKPVYTAETRLAVGGIDLSQPGALSGFATSSAALAATYSRVAQAQGVVVPVASQMHMSPDVVRRRILATPIPESPVFRLDAKAKSASAAIALANASASSLVHYVDQLNSAAPRAKAFYGAYRRAAKTYQEAFAAKETAQQDYASSKTEARRQAVVDARITTNAANLRLKSLTDAYLQAAGRRDDTVGVQQLTPATSASSDRRSKVETYGFGGLAGGLLAGAALATFWANWRRRRLVR